jgi:serine/threonine protein phosphatase PrpC
MGNSSSHDFSISACTDKETLSGESPLQQIQYAVSGMRGLRPTMEDKHIHLTSLSLPDEPPNEAGEAMLDDHSIFAIFDGHGGSFASAFLQSNLLSTLREQPEMKKYVELRKTGQKSRSDTNGVVLLRQALNSTFIELDKKLIEQQKEKNSAILEGRATSNRLINAGTDSKPEGLSCASPTSVTCQTPVMALSELKASYASSPIERSGSTGVVVILTPSHIICANTGDSRAILRRSGRILPLSFDHKPSDIAERARIYDAGGIVKGRRIDGDLAVSRAFGDFIFKSDSNLPIERQKVSVVPDITVYPRNEQNDEFVVMACDGVWDVATSEDCANYVQTLLSAGEINLSHICEEALDTCLERNSRDNMTILIVGFPGMKANTERAAELNSGFWNAQTTRMARKFTHRTALLATRAFKSLSKDLAICT